MARHIASQILILATGVIYRRRPLRRCPLFISKTAKPHDSDSWPLRWLLPMESSTDTTEKPGWVFEGGTETQVQTETKEGDDRDDQSVHLLKCLSAALRVTTRTVATTIRQAGVTVRGYWPNCYLFWSHTNASDSSL